VSPEALDHLVKMAQMCQKKMKRVLIGFGPSRTPLPTALSTNSIRAAAARQPACCLLMCKPQGWARPEANPQPRLLAQSRVRMPHPPGSADM